MANRYGEAALMVARQAASNISPEAQWEEAMEKLYPTSAGARKKASPRGAFLGLCEEGLVKGIPAGHYTTSKDKDYAVHAAALLAEGSQHWSISTLWQAVAKNPQETHNGQMDIVLALWKNGLLVSKS